MAEGEILHCRSYRSTIEEANARAQVAQTCCRRLASRRIKKQQCLNAGPSQSWRDPGEGGE